MTCDECGVELAIGDYPFCPHGRSTLATIPDDVPGGFIVENGFEQPTRFDSHSAHEQALAQRGYEVRAKWAGPEDTHLTRWDTVDLDGARMLLERGGQARREKQKDPPIPITVREITGSVKARDI